MDGGLDGPIGFTLFLLFPLVAALLEVLGYFSPSPPSIQAYAALYPLGLAYLSISPVVYRSATPVSQAGYEKFTSGARKAALPVVAVSLVGGAIMIFLFRQSSIGFGLWLIGVGSILIPSASAAPALASQLATDDGAKRFADGVRKHSYRRADTSFLAFYLGNYDILGRDLQVSLLLPLSLALYVRGWVLLSMQGGFPITIFGVVMLFAVMLSSYLYLRHSVNVEGQQRISGLLASILPSTPVRGGRLGRVVLYLLVIALIITILARY